MSAAYDDRCGRCSEPVAPDSTRVSCGRCLRDHHEPCWSAARGCSECGSVETLADKDARRRERRARWIRVLIVLTLLDGVVWILSVPFTWPLRVDDVIVFDLLAVVGFVLLIPLFAVVTRIR
jgi:hypothetical protein